MNAALQHETLTRSVEDYLKAIYRLSPRGRPAATSEIAHRLELSPASVSGMVKRLSEQGLLVHVPYKGVQLTPEGRRARYYRITAAGLRQLSTEKKNWARIVMAIGLILESD